MSSVGLLNPDWDWLVSLYSTAWLPSRCSQLELQTQTELQNGKHQPFILSWVSCLAFCYQCRLWRRLSPVYTGGALSNYWDLGLEALVFIAWKTDEPVEQSISETHLSYLYFLYSLFIHCYYKSCVLLRPALSLAYTVLYRTVLYYSVLYCTIKN